MKASCNWLRELSQVTATPAEMAERLTGLGLEVEAIERFGAGLDNVVVAEVRAAERVPERDKLTLVTVFDGQGERKVICGASNVPGPGGRVVLALPGAVLPGGMAIAERAVGGVTSSGMLCSERELGIGEGHGGILVLGGGDPGRPGQLVREALSLDDAVLHIGLTPNRPDCLGHLGLARELAVASGVPFHPPPTGVPTRVISGADRGDGPDDLPLVDSAGGTPIDTLTLVDARPGVPTVVAVDIQAPDRCPRYAACVVQGVRVQPSPLWLRHRLHVLGVRAIDCVVDATNYVLLEHGHPIHAFDLATLRGPAITVRLATAGETMRTLDGVDRALTVDDLLICDAGGPVALAGVMGGEGSAISATTRDVLIEVAYFDPPGVRRTSRRLGIHTDSSHRFERGVDPNGVRSVIRRAAALLCAHAGGASSPVARDYVPQPIGQRQIQLDPAHVGRLLGSEVPDSDVRAALEALGCNISPGETSGWRVSCPTSRPDLTRPEDLVEEVARVRGYEKIAPRIPRVTPSGRGLAPRLRLVRRVREAAISSGLFEAVNYSFVSRADLERARVATDAIELANPLSEERAVMRTSLLPGLLADVERSRRHQASEVRVFEIAKVYLPVPGQALPREAGRFALALAGARIDHVGPAAAHDFYDGKGALTSVLEGALGLAVETAIDDALAADAPYLHPQRRARVHVAGRQIGVLGEIHPDVSDAWDLDARVVYAELDVDALLEVWEARGPAQARPLPRFPAVSRDLSLEIDEGAHAGTLAEALREAGGELVEAIELFDVYRGAGIDAGRKSLAFRIVYRDAHATLTDAKVDQAHRAVIAAAQGRLGATIRD